MCNVAALTIVAVMLLLTGCAPALNRDPELLVIDRGRLPVADLNLNIPGLGPCTDSAERGLQLTSHEPVVILVHGCLGSAGRFRALAEVFAFHGQQTACFSYNDRDSMMESSAQLIAALDALSAEMGTARFTVIGHSQGGLVARKALVAERPKPLEQGATSLRLVTISSPFAGISSAETCGSTVAKVATLGLIVPVCQLISGDKWFEITAASDFIRQPGKLLGQVDGYLKIVTDERGTCRRIGADGSCAESDYVFSLAEQYFPPIDNESPVTDILVKAGHVEIAGDQRVTPVKLISILQERGIMRKTEPERKAALDTLLAELYGGER
jgi:hypothetical protein